MGERFPDKALNNFSKRMRLLTGVELSATLLWMATFTTRQAAKLLGINAGTLSRYISAKKIPAPKTIESGGFRVHQWTERDIERVRKLLPKIQNGRKTRYKKRTSEE